MKKYLRLLIAPLFMTATAFGADPFQSPNPLVVDFPNVIKLVRENINGWAKLALDGGRTVFTPRAFYAEKISDPKVWITQVRELGFCQPDKVWKNFPVLAVANEALSNGFEQVALNPKAHFATQMLYSETVIVGGKARNVSYDYRQQGPQVNVTCSAANEAGDVQSIEQAFDIRDPKKFGVQQKKNGKLLQI